MDHPREIGDWTNISVLGSGGFGTVLLWRSNTTNEYIAVKKCRIQCQSSLTSRQKSRWKHEVEKMKELCHPNIVKHKPLPPFLEEELNKFNPTKLPLLSLEYCDKGNLRHTLILPENLRGLKEESVRDLLLDISGAVSYLHQRNITHRDIKPENIVLHTWPERERGVIYKLIDLGYAKELGDATVSFVGTLLYLAPEIFSNQYYDCSVDYWSLGVLAFEVICGVLPFPAIMGTAERFRAIKNKGPEDICVYKSILGNLQYSTQLFKEIWISTCLKDHMEVWLRKALQFNPTLRSAPFPTTLNIFNQLNLILRKRILTVFSVYRYEFYSYEFDECTRLSTVRQWIARDTKIAENDQLLLGIIDFDNCDDQTLLIHCLCEEKNKIFVFKKNVLFNKDNHQIPRRVKLMFEKATELFSWREIKAIYADAIFYISQDVEHAANFSISLDQYLKKVVTLVQDVHKRAAAIRQLKNNMVRNVEIFNRILKKLTVPVENIGFFEKCFQLFSALQKCITDEDHLDLAVKKWIYKIDFMKNMYINAKTNVINVPKIKESLEMAVRLLHRTEADNNDNLSVVEMSKIVSSVMKMKSKLLLDSNLNEFVKYLGKAMNFMKSLGSWIPEFHSHVEKLSNLLDLVLVDLTVKEKSAENNAKQSNVDVKTIEAISEELCSKIDKDLTDVLEQLKKFCDEILSTCDILNK